MMTPSYVSQSISGYRGFEAEQSVNGFKDLFSTSSHTCRDTGLDYSISSHIQNRWKSQKRKGHEKDSCLSFITTDHLTFTDLLRRASFPPSEAPREIMKPRRLRTLRACVVGRSTCWQLN